MTTPKTPGPGHSKIPERNLDREQSRLSVLNFSLMSQIDSFSLVLVSVQRFLISYSGGLSIHIFASMPLYADDIAVFYSHPTNMMRPIFLPTPSHLHSTLLSSSLFAN